MAMNAKSIQQRLFAQYGGSSSLMVPNYTPAGWFESDLYRVTKAGYGEEFEIKLSVADFKADAKKGPDEREKQWVASMPDYSPTKQKFDPRTKHERLAGGDSRGPCRFWFAMPESLAKSVTIPDWAGLIVFRERYSYGQVIKPAPQLHKVRVDPKVSDHALRVFYFRYWEIRKELQKTQPSLPL